MFGVGDGRRKADPPGFRRQLLQSRQPERQQIAALGRRQRMQLVENDVAQPLEIAPGMGIGDQQRDLFRRCQQDVGRVLPLALTAVYFLPAVLRAWLLFYWAARDEVRALKARRAQTHA